ncbi:hypothetical protein ACRAWD_07255 [Caulobacter segnis]
MAQTTQASKADDTVDEVIVASNQAEPPKRAQAPVQPKLRRTETIGDSITAEDIGASAGPLWRPKRCKARAGRASDQPWLRPPASIPDHFSAEGPGAGRGPAWPRTGSRSGTERSRHLHVANNGRKSSASADVPSELMGAGKYDVFKRLRRPT